MSRGIHRGRHSRRGLRLTWPKVLALVAVAGLNVVGTLNLTRTSAAAAPGAPQQVLATPGNGTAQVSWAAPAPDGSAPPTSYTITATGGSAPPPLTVSAPPATISGLQNGVTYTFSVTATNPDGTGPAALSNRATPGSADALVQIDTGYQPAQPVSASLVGSGMGWSGAENTASAYGSLATGAYFPNMLPWMANGGNPSGGNPPEPGEDLTWLRYPSGQFANCYDWKQGVGKLPRPGQLINYTSAHNCYKSGQAAVFGTNEFMREVLALRALPQESGVDVEPIIQVNICTTNNNSYCNTICTSACNPTQSSPCSPPTCATTPNGDPPLCPDPTLADVSVGCPGAVAAAEWLAYLNGSTTSTQPLPDGTTVGVWATQRTTDPNGSVQPYGVRYFEFGNETTLGLKQYEQVLATYVTQMRAVDPTIVVIAGDSKTESWYNAGLLQADGSLLTDPRYPPALLAPHIYADNGDTQSWMSPGQPDQVTAILDGIQEAVDAAGYHGKIGILPTEWNAADKLDPDPPAPPPPTTPDPGEQWLGDMRAALDQETDLQAMIRHDVAGTVYFTFDGGNFRLIHCSTTTVYDSNGDCQTPTSPAPFRSIPGHVVAMLNAGIDPYWSFTQSTLNAVRALATVQPTHAHVQLVNLDSTAHTVQVSFAGVTPTGSVQVQSLSGTATAIDTCDVAIYNQPCPGGARTVVPSAVATYPAASTLTLQLPAVSFTMVSVPITTPVASGIHPTFSPAPALDGFFHSPVTVSGSASSGLVSCGSETYTGPDGTGIQPGPISCTDLVSGAQATVKPPPIAFDDVPPTTTIGSYSATAKTLSGTATDDLSGVSTVVVTFTPSKTVNSNQLKMTETYSCARALSCAWTVSTASGLSAGTYTVGAYALDDAGNQGPTSNATEVIG